MHYHATIAGEAHYQAVARTEAEAFRLVAEHGMAVVGAIRCCDCDWAERVLEREESEGVAKGGAS